MSRCKHDWCDIEEASAPDLFVFRCWRCRAIVQFSLTAYGLHAHVADVGLVAVLPDEVVSLAEGLLALMASALAPAPPVRHRKISKSVPSVGVSTSA